MNRQHPTLSIQPDLSIPPSRIAEYRGRSGGAGPRFQAVLAETAPGRGPATGMAPPQAPGDALRAAWPGSQARPGEPATAGMATAGMATTGMATTGMATAGMAAPEYAPAGATAGLARSIPLEPRQVTVTPPETRHRNDGRFFGPDGFDGDDLIDIVNPLHHLPIVGMVYRQVTGDRISPGAKIVGGGIIGGPAGLISSMVRVGIERTTGQSLGGHVAALAGFEHHGTAGQSRAASAYARAARANQPEFAALAVNAATPPPSPPPPVLAAAAGPGPRPDGSDRPVAALPPRPAAVPLPAVAPLPSTGGVALPVNATWDGDRVPVRYVWSAGAPGRAVAATLAGVPDRPVRQPVGPAGRIG